jgi:hypothetical protein
MLGSFMDASLQRRGEPHIPRGLCSAHQADRLGRRKRIKGLELTQRPAMQIDVPRSLALEDVGNVGVGRARWPSAQGRATAISRTESLVAGRCHI